MKSLRVALIIGCGVALLGACSDDSTGPVVSDDPRTLTRKDHAIELLQRAYDGMVFEDVEKLLHADFVFHFSPADVDEGNVSVTDWSRTEELDATGKLFEQGPAASSPRLALSAAENASWGFIKHIFREREATDPPTASIELEITHDAGDENWTQVDHHGRSFVPGAVAHESNWTKDITYTITVRAGETVYTTETPRRARLTIRIGLATTYRLVEWRDGLP